MSDTFPGPCHRRPGYRHPDVYAFPCPQSPRHLVLIMNVFPYAGPSARPSDAGHIPVPRAPRNDHIRQTHNRHQRR